MWLFAIFGAAMVIAFWPSYFSRLTVQPTSHAHQHGIVMTLWCALLVGQAWLIRSGRRAMHRRLGTLSYVLVPLIVVTTARFVHFRVSALPGLTPNWLFFVALVLDTLLVFVVLYGLAMYHRRNAALHARYMVCTLFPLLPPVTDRLIAFYQPALIARFPTIGGGPVLQLFGFALGDAIVAALAVWDWRVNRRADAFPLALVLLVAAQTLILTSHGFAWWAAFGEWFRRVGV